MDFFRGFIKGFKEFSELIANTFNFLILSVVYFIGIGMTSIFAKLFGKHFLKMKKPNSESYWEEREPISKNIEDYYNQF